MPRKSTTSNRKADHIRINLQEDVRSGVATGLEDYRFTHQALPELNLTDIDLTLSLFGYSLRAPILISSMTGGASETANINRALAIAAQETGIAMGMGSQRAALENPALVSTFQVRDVAPNILLFANLGAIQLNNHLGVEDCQRTVDMIQADGLILHLNPLQEAVQPEGDTNFGGLLEKIEAVCKTLEVPVIVKEVGWGFSERAARQLVNAGVSALDVAGAGGTSWTQVEMHRAQTENQRKLAATFRDWGIPTAESILHATKAGPNIPVFASGGLRSGVDVAKCLALGATLGGMARTFLKAATISPEKTIQIIKNVKRELQVAMFAAGAGNLTALAHTPLTKK
ncbi:MAG: type 2 isopentenyl-diphosphate Delta-isomerase [Chloroflexota bacterium]|nr:MAG: type 2 isopentenyl-diphosphate Delta-isomerase [Chloroflexota bacterium]